MQPGGWIAHFEVRCLISVRGMGEVYRVRGTRPLQKNSAPETMVAILKDEPPDLVEIGKSIPQDPPGIVPQRSVAGASAVLLLACAASAAKPSQLAIQIGHVGSVVEVSWSPNGAYVASRGSRFDDASVKIWDPESGRLLASVRPAPLSGMRWSPDGSHVAVWEEEGTFYIWNARTGAIDATFKVGGTVRDAAWSPDGHRLAVALRQSCVLVEAGTWVPVLTLPNTTGPLRYSRDGSRLFAGGTVWEAAGDRAIARLEGFQPGMFRLDPTDWSPDGQLIASVAVKALHVWSASDGHLVQEITSPTQLRDIAWSPDGSMLAVGSLTAKVYRASPARTPFLEPLADATGPESWIESLGWSRDGSRLAAGSADGSLTIWNAASFAIAARIKAHEKEIHSIAWSPGADIVATASADANVRVWGREGQPAATMTAHTRAQLAVGWSADSRFIAAGPDNGPVRVWEIESGQIITALEGEKQVDLFLAELWKAPAFAQVLSKPTSVHKVRALQWAAQGDRLAVLATNGRNTIEVWEPLHNRRTSTIDLTVPSVLSFAWSPDGRQFAVGSRTDDKDARATRIIGAADGSEQGSISEKLIEGKDIDVRSLAWSPDGALLARSGSGLTSTIADLKTRELIGKGIGGCCVAFSPNGLMLAAGGPLWDMRNRTLVGTIPAESAAAISWSPDSSRLAIAKECEVTIVDVRSSRTVATLAGHERDITGLAWSADGRHLVTASQDGSLRIWTAGGEMLATLLVLDEGRDWLIITPDGLFDGSPDAWRLVGWHSDPSDYLKVDPVEIFFREYFYPGLLPDVLRGKRPRPQVPIDGVDRRQPRLAFASPAAGANPGVRELEVTLDVSEVPRDAGHSIGSGARDVRLFRNGTLVAYWGGDVLKGKGRARLTTVIPVVAGENRLVAWAFNASNIKSADALVTVTGSDRLARRGRMRIVVVGIDRHANPAFDLRYARADAAAFGEELKQRQLGLGVYESVDVISLFDVGATREAILAALRKAAADAAPEDALVVFFAGHGIASGPRFHLIPHDLGYEGARADINRTSFEAMAQKSISDLDLEGVFRSAGAERILLVVDACNSGQALESEEHRRGPMNSKGLAQLAWEKGMHVITAAQGYQAALETAQLGHGLLTWALVEEGVRRGVADWSPRDGVLVVREWLDYAARRVPQLQEQAMHDARAQGREVAFVDGEQAVRELARRSLQRPRVFYRREPEREPFVIARP